MQRCVLLLAYFFICVTCLSQQYLFVHYSPKDGLGSNRVRSLYQDSKGRLYFLTMNGLSIYDGASFTNFISERDGYWELLVDKSLPKGEYAFTIMSMMSMDGAVTIFAFGIN